MSDKKKKRSLREEFAIIAYNLCYFGSFKNPHDQGFTPVEIHLTDNDNEWNKIATKQFSSIQP